MTLDEFMVLKDKLKQIPGLKRVVFCGIGESLLNPEIYKIFGELKDYNISMVTSGTVLIDYARLAQYGNVDMIVFSIDATSEESVKSICGKNYNYKNLLTNLEKFRQYKKSKKTKLKTLLNSTVSANNLEEISNIMDFARDHRFPMVHFSLAWGGEDFIIRNLDRLRKAFAAAHQKARRYGIYCDNPFRSYCCINVDTILAFIGLNGNIYPCGYGLNRNYIVGNIHKEPFDATWQSDAYARFKKGNLCDSCYMLRMTGINEGKITLEDLRQATAPVTA